MLKIIKNHWFKLVLGFQIVFVIYGIYRNNRIDYLMNGRTKKNKAIIMHISDGAAIHCLPSAKYYYYVQNIKYYFSNDGNFNHLKKGDTILIKYSLEDPSKSRVIDKYYMRKYHYLRNQ
jgi:hypothetical protein